MDRKLDSTFVIAEFLYKHIGAQHPGGPSQANIRRVKNTAELIDLLEYADISNFNLEELKKGIAFAEKDRKLKSKYDKKRTEAVYWAANPLPPVREMAVNFTDFIADEIDKQKKRFDTWKFRRSVDRYHGAVPRIRASRG